MLLALRLAGPDPHSPVPALRLVGLDLRFPELAPRLAELDLTSTLLLLGREAPKEPTI